MILNYFKQKIKNAREQLVNFYNDDQGIGTVEVILILVVLIGLVVIFRDQLTTIMNGIFDRIVTDSNAI